mgnify:CR=1 FL=1
MSRKSLRAFLEQEIRDAKEKGVLFSIHMKATMMKVSDPIIFGEAVNVFFKELLSKQRLQQRGILWKTYSLPQLSPLSPASSRASLPCLP